MDVYRHNVSASFAQRSAAELSLAQLVQRGMSREQLQIFDAGKHEPANLSTRLGSRGTRNSMLRYGGAGAVIGGVLGGLVQAGLVVSDMGLLMASPVLAPIMLVGSGAFLGAFVGALAGVSSLTPKPSPLMQDEVADGGSVLLANTRSAEETAMAREVLTASSGTCKDEDMSKNARSGWLS
ncbi:hypothetical protein [Ectopseudomonas mendocina]|uniref:hypothetical protein n=1 Tax=Ectopseudomonas mendocina TaxID=300 RepID=UPI0005A21B4C|nr:hypothetical protein [Pseudomonas mendocina]